MTNIVQLKDYISKKNVDITADPSFQKLVASFGMFLHPYGSGIFLLTPKEKEFKASPMKLAAELRERGWFTAVVNNRLFVVTQSQAKSNQEAKHLRNQLNGIEERANNAIGPSLKALAKTSNVSVSKFGECWLVKPKGQRASPKLLTKTDKRLLDFSKVARKFGLHMEAFSTVEKGKFKQYALLGHDRKNLSAMVSKYSSGSLDTSALYAADEAGKREEIERMGYSLKELKDGHVLIKKEARDVIIPADILKLRSEMEEVALDVFPGSNLSFTIHVANSVSYHLGIAHSILSAVKISRHK